MLSRAILLSSASTTNHGDSGVSVCHQGFKLEGVCRRASASKVNLPMSMSLINLMNRNHLIN